MVRKQLALLFIVVITCIGIGFVINSNNNTKIEKIFLSQKEEIFEEAKFRLKPIVETQQNLNTVYIIIEITSYIYPELLTHDYAKQMLIEFNEKIYNPIEWKVIEENNHRIIGQLTFEIKETIPVKDFTLQVFLGDKYEVNWN